MADPRDDEDEGNSKGGELSDAQRIAKLEKSLSRQTLISSIVALLVLLMLTFFSVGYFALNGRVTSNTENGAGPQEADIKVILDKQFKKYTGSLPSSDDLTDSYLADIRSFHDRLDDLDVYTKKSSVAELRQILLAREKTDQTFLFALGTGMLSLSKMVRGSRAWFEEYNAQLTSAIKASKAREKSLKKLIAVEKTRLKMLKKTRR